MAWAGCCGEGCSIARNLLLHVVDEIGNQGLLSFEHRMNTLGGDNESPFLHIECASDDLKGKADTRDVSPTFPPI